MAQPLCCHLQVEVTQLSLIPSLLLSKSSAPVLGSCGLLGLALHPSTAAHNMLCDPGDARNVSQQVLPSGQRKHEKLI